MVEDTQMFDAAGVVVREPKRENKNYADLGTVEKEIVMNDEV